MIIVDVISLATDVGRLKQNVKNLFFFLLRINLIGLDGDSGKKNIDSLFAQIIIFF